MTHTILVVEDDANINEVVTEYLKDSGFITISAYDGGSALDIINENENIDLFVLDIMLPKVSGIEILKKIREDIRHNEKPVMILTALADEYTQIASFNEMADDYVTKPFSSKILVKRVEALLRRTGKMSNTMKTGNITIDSNCYEAYENNKKIPLTLREFELLKTLLINSHKVLTRQQLLNHVWGYDYFGDERIVDVHIKNLRKKIASNIIATVKGVGYRLSPEGDEFET